MQNFNYNKRINLQVKKPHMTFFLAMLMGFGPTVLEETRSPLWRIGNVSHPFTMDSKICDLSSFSLPLKIGNWTQECCEVFITTTFI